ncbi:lactose-binding lectin l-2-like [Poeciliopsis prolifica]|uniref:lactose-binding lectin l-2-like n=1 Tax=Poeciliopsis prolifica TaxID=188132 RepID=UPI0024140934|nr:lactose-binding lectin l-2-like [Poeciliopsis prolifica]
MMWFLFLVGLALAAEPPSDGQELKLLRGGCPMFWYSFKGRCYKYVASRMTWGEAEVHCLTEGGNLVSIHSLEEHNFVNNLIKNFDPTQDFTWIGLTDIHKEGTWMWSDGSKYDFSLWHPGEPSNDGGQGHCGHTNFVRDKYWNDHFCSHKKALVCASRINCC